MAALADLELHQQALGDLTTLAQRDLLAFWRTLDHGDAAAVLAALEDVLPDLIATYGTAAAALAADWYDDLRDQAAPDGTFVAAPADPAPAERAAVLARWAVGPLFGAEPDAGLALSRLAGGVQRTVAGTDRATIESNIDADPASPRYARHASANACAFCALVATRGPVYRSEASAGAKYHDHCHCIAVPDWGDFEAAPYVAKWDAAYRQATRAVGGTDTQKVLAHMRRTLGAH